MKVTAGLPRPRSGLIGREDDVGRLVDALASSSGRLVSVVGPGGMGKTRLAIEVAHRSVDRWRDGATFVPLAGVAAPEHLPDALAGSLHLAGSAGRGTLPALISALQGREALLVLDNFEQLLPAAEVVAQVLDACEGIRVLVTSRFPLQLEREHVVELGPLAVPDEPDGDVATGDLDAVGAVASVQLFVERARVADVDFELTGATASLAAEIVRRLGGSPLAIELAAARLAILSTRQLHDRLAAEPLNVLSGGSPRRPERHRSLRSTIAWTYDLLSEPERAVLRRLSVFEHSFSLEAGEAVAVVPELREAEAPAGEAGELLDSLSALVDARLVEPIRRAAGEEPRFSMPVIIRDFAREQLALAGEEDTVRSRLIAEVERFGQEAAAHLESEREQEWLDLVAVELDQIRVVLEWLGGDVEARLRLAAALGPYWLHRGLLGEGRRHLAPALDPHAVSSVDPSLVAAAAAWEARLAADQGVIADRDGADDMVRQLEQGLAAARADGDVHAELRCIDFLSHVLFLHDDSGRAAEITDEGVRRAREEGRPWWLGQLLQRAAVFARMRGDLDTAADLITEAYRIAQELRAERLLLHAGLTVVQLPPNDRITDPPDLDGLIDLAIRLGDQRMRCVVQMSIGIEALVAGQFPEAADAFRTAIGAARDSGYWHATGFSLMCCAGLAAVVGDHEACARLHGASLEAQPVLRRGMPPAYHALYLDLIAGARAGLGDELFDRLATDTAALGWDYAVAVATTLLDRVAPGARAPSRIGAEPGVDEVTARTPLTERELEVLACIAAGDTNKDIARRLSITPKTVMHHTTSIYRKLGVRGRAEAAAIALRQGLITP